MVKLCIACAPGHVEWLGDVNAGEFFAPVGGIRWLLLGYLRVELVVKGVQLEVGRMDLSKQALGVGVMG